MTTLIAMAGKGGTGKTTFAALLIRSLIKRGLEPVLAVDADPNATLSEALGVEMPRTIGDVREEFGKLSGNLPAGMTKGMFFEYKLNEVIYEGDGFDLLVMGTRGHSAIHDLILGRTAEQVMRSIKAPVLMVP